MKIYEFCSFLLQDRVCRTACQPVAVLHTSRLRRCNRAITPLPGFGIVPPVWHVTEICDHDYDHSSIVAY